MRSRDGNHSFTLRLCSLILLSSLALKAGEYLISYKYTVKNSILYNESLEIAKSMTKCSGEIASKSLILPASNAKDFKALIVDNHEEFIDYIHTLGLHIKNNEITINNQIQTTTIMTLKTTCFKVDFNDNFVRISHLEDPIN